MSIPRFFMEDTLPEGEVVTLPFNDKEIRHIRVNRIEPGEHIACCSTGGNCWEVEVVSVSEDGVVGRCIEKMPVEVLPNLTLVQGVSKGDRMGQTIRQTTELGVQRIIPFLSERTIVRLSASDRPNKGARWRRIALSAAKQSGRTLLPNVDDPLVLSEICEELADFDLIIIAWEEADQTADGNAMGIGDALEGFNSENKIALVVGPEGGLTKGEVEAFRALGNAKVVTMGKLILRTETAATVATALCMYELGSLGNNK